MVKNERKGKREEIERKKENREEKREREKREDQNSGMSKTWLSRGERERERERERRGPAMYHLQLQQIV